MRRRGLERGCEPRERGRSSQTGIEHALVYWYRASRSGAFGYSKPWPRFWLKVVYLRLTGGLEPLRPRPDVQQIKSRQRIFQPIRTDVPLALEPVELGHALLPGLDDPGLTQTHHRRLSLFAPRAFRVHVDKLRAQPRQERPHVVASRRRAPRTPPRPDPPDGGPRDLSEPFRTSPDDLDTRRTLERRRPAPATTDAASSCTPCRRSCGLCAPRRARVPRPNRRSLPGSIPPLAAAPRHPPPPPPPIDPPSACASSERHSKPSGAALAVRSDASDRSSRRTRAMASRDRCVAESSSAGASAAG